MENRRKEKRHALSRSLQVFELDAATKESLGYVVDINTSGMMLKTPKRLPVNQDFLCEIRLHDSYAASFFDGGNAHNKKIRFTARTVWIKRDETPAKGKPRKDLQQAQFNTGMRLIEISPSALLSISYLIQKFSKHENQ